MGSSPTALTQLGIHIILADTTLLLEGCAGSSPASGTMKNKITKILILATVLFGVFMFAGCDETATKVGPNQYLIDDRGDSIDKSYALRVCDPRPLDSIVYTKDYHYAALITCGKLPQDNQNPPQKDGGD